MKLSGLLNDSPTAQKLAAMLPVSVEMSRWGDEYSGSLPAMNIGPADDAREEMRWASWPTGRRAMRCASSSGRRQSAKAMSRGLRRR